MAAEINESTPVEAPANSEPEAVPKISDDLHNGDSNPPSVNGTATSGSPDELSNKHIADNVDDLVNSAEPSISGGSDTETSRLDAAKNKDGDKGHVRTSSTARKPTTFKSVSVNKTFLAAKAAGTAGVAKPGDKASPTLGVASLTSASSASPRPRLVAKTGLVKGPGANGRPAAAPDPNAVWNKNRPVVPPDPRKLTDEELKKYGIHISTRLQQNDDGKGQANWADIDDDDEDWAPEEITWTDGTKSTIPHHDEIQPSPQPHSVQPDMSHTQSHFYLQAHSQSPQAQQHSVASASQPSPTAIPSSLSREVDANDKPKSPAPTGVRSGGLPSGRGLILKGAPEKPTLVAKPPAPPTPVKSPWASLPPVDKASPVTMDLPPSIGNSRLPYQQSQFHQYPPRDMYGGPPRGSTPPPPFKEIAADDFSRGGFRDSHPYANRELYNSQSGRMEPVQDRRGSMRGDMHHRQPPSALLQRQSHGSDQQPEPSAAFQTHRSAHEGPYGRRRNSSNVSGGSGSFMQRLGRPHDQNVPPELLHAQQPSLAGRSDSPTSPRNFSPSGTRSWQAHGSPAATLASTHSNPQSNAPPGSAQPHTQGAPQAASASIEDELEIQKKIMRERRELAKKRRLEEEEREEAAKRERIRLKLEAMGPAPERKSAKKEPSKDEAAPATAAAAPVTPIQVNANLSTPGGEATTDAGASGSNHPMHATEHDSGVPATAENTHDQSQQQPQTWQSPVPPQTERMASWGSTNQSTRNVWGSPNNRSLGNGTFTSDLGPIGPPSVQKNAAAPPMAPIGPPKSTVSLPPPPPPADVQRTSARSAVAQQSAGGNSAEVARSAWANAVKASDETQFAQQKAQRAEQQREAEARGLGLKDLHPAIKDTWLPTRMNEDGNRVEDKANQSVVHRPGTTVGGSSSPGSTIHSQSRPSRFFPTRDTRLEDAVAAAQGTALGGASAINSSSQGRPGSPSPPPPDMDGHPAFDGDAAHPHVSLPRPQIVVRLPPKDTTAAAEHPPASGSHAKHTQLRSAASHANESQSTPSDGASWQAKFNNLFDRKPAVSPSKPTSGAGRHDMQNRTSSENTAPTSTKAPVAPRSVKATPKEPFTTRLMAEDCFERQEMGSLPPVHLPNKVPELAWTPAPIPKPLARRFLLSTATSGDHEGFLKDYFGVPHSVSIQFPGMAGNGKSVNLPTPRTNSNPRRTTYGRSGSGRHGSSHRGGNKNRDASSTHSVNDKTTPPSTRQGSSGGRSRGGGMRHRSENWTRGTSAPVQT
ncbi:hypothetical protein HMPREF1624_02061 [Sporothrix schenckii ATCC 58251]|uniref:Uncharacterized protein n=1 Tax=Sporothrix schenckii (strain ATCC 58251 / de Perez 2211183) TaxID=1391915 RepID=U7PYZ7_SPOS1|nr:hypothetical protein HMPREF1624_02061 [Sporothrix schenckii ATCC 58251]